MLSITCVQISESALVTASTAKSTICGSVCSASVEALKALGAFAMIVSISIKRGQSCASISMRPAPVVLVYDPTMLPKPCGGVLLCTHTPLLCILVARKELTSLGPCCDRLFSSRVLDRETTCRIIRLTRQGGNCVTLLDHMIFACLAVLQQSSLGWLLLGNTWPLLCSLPKGCLFALALILGHLLCRSVDT